ncbi:uncharacterized protein LOC129612488 [Condylostylus longicornis]|uniref:uncharacterized protein LOC129612488 n=1 Tax=Condylostylus longicornis TaxID=2530218 RepID=UPI00244E24E5|nr:uncharacterized protein LOC129612488 [Condylostylus longicornis]
MKHSTTILIFFIIIFNIELSISDDNFELTPPLELSRRPCDRNDLDLDDCLKNLIQDQIQKNIDGSETLNIPPLEPWSLPKTKYLYSQQNGIRMTLTTENVQIHGLKRTTIVNVSTKFQNDLMSVDMMIHLPKIRMSGNYSAKIRVNDLKIRPRGKFNMTLSNVLNNMKLTGTIERFNNQRFLKLKKFSLDPIIEDIRFNVTGIFPADPSLNNVFVQFINSYWRNLYPAIIRETKADWEPMLLNATNQFLTHIPFDNVIKDSKI